MLESGGKWDGENANLNHRMALGIPCPDIWKTKKPYLIHSVTPQANRHPMNPQSLSWADLIPCPRRKYLFTPVPSNSKMGRVGLNGEKTYMTPQTNNSLLATCMVVVTAEARTSPNKE
ncbi:hypothetical protein H106_02496 [Trichophyton rubrum CBS 735.88]|nr:hypothetical protein H106_02496 [Trichophyton rubrum CBS 735.88]